MFNFTIQNRRFFRYLCEFSENKLNFLHIFIQKGIFGGDKLDNFVTIVGFCLGALIILCSFFVCAAPGKYIFAFLLNSFLGCVIISLVNVLLKTYGLGVGINPITAVCVGIMGIPGAVAVILLAIFL